MPEKGSLYLEIVEAVRQKILGGELNAGSELPSIREMSSRWNCAPGTVQRAYRELARLGLVSTQVGQGSRVASQLEAYTPLRRATLVNQIEAFMLDVLAAGYSSKEIDEANHEVLERWEARAEMPLPGPTQVIRFVGSDDPVISLIAHRYSDFTPNHSLAVTFAGSLGGLMALARNGADIAGCHLWDAETGLYNTPFVRRLLPGQRVALVTLARRRLGLIVPVGNPKGIKGLEDLSRDGLRFINRQRGAGTRVWLEEQLREMGTRPEQIVGYRDEVRTHLEVAGIIAEGKADVGLGVEAAALAYSQDFVLLTTERYDLVIPAEVWSLPAVQAMVRWLSTEEAKAAIVAIGGYDTEHTGEVEWVG
jgi:molybdate-binding protein/DNA-binding transcriptional regulator YhcF (GntR family)